MEVFGGWKPIYTPLLLLPFLLSLTAATFCAPGKQYLSTKLELCLNCTECTGGSIVVRPCEVHRDTVCRPIGDILRRVPPNPHRHRHQQRHRGGEHPDGGAEAPPDQQAPSSTEAPFSRAEALVWDWQAIALSSAVFACFLFFLAITVYSLHQARQWRRLKDNFDADVEELSAKLSLMAAASSSEKGESMEPRLADGNYLNSRCVYLEQLLNVRKDTKMGKENGGGNVYIEESSTSKT